MDTIIIKPKTAHELKEVLAVLKRMKVKTERYKEPTKEEVLRSVEKGAKAASLYIQGRHQLKEADDFLNAL